MNTYTIAFLVVVVIGVVLYFYEKITMKKIFPTIQIAFPILSAATMLAKTISATTDNEYFKTFVVVMQAATDATQKAEELWLKGSLPKDKRYEYAHQFIEETLAQAGIAVTAQINDMITGFIAMVACLLPHGLIPEGSETNDV